MMKRSLKVILSALTALVLPALGWAAVQKADPVPNAFFSDFSSITTGTTKAETQLKHCGVTLTLPAGITKNGNGTINLEEVGATLVLPSAVTGVTVVLDLAETPGTGTLVHFKAVGNISAYSTGTQITGYWGEGANGTAVDWTPAAGKFLAATSTTAGTTIIAGESTYTNSGLKSGTNTYQTIYIGSYNNTSSRVTDLTLRAIYVYTSYKTSMPTFTDITAYTREIANEEAWNTADWSVDGVVSDVTNPTGSATLTVAGDATLTLDANAVLYALSVTGGNSLRFSGTSPLTSSFTEILTNTDVSGITGTVNLGAVTIAAGKTLTVGANTTWTSMSGAGTLVLTAKPNTFAISVSDAWTGTVKVECALGNAFNYNAIGRKGSTIEITSKGSANYFAQNAQIAANLVINGTISQNNGWSDNGGATLSGTITGTGTLQASGNQSDVIRLTGDASGFAGTITVNGKHVISFGPQTDLGDDSNLGKLFIQSGKTANVAVNKTWTATGGVHIYGAIGGAGKIGSATTFYDGATIDASTNALTVTGAITIGDGATVNVLVKDNPTVGDVVLTCASAEDATAIVDNLTSDTYAFTAEDSAIKVAAVCTAGETSYASIQQAVDAQATDITVSVDKQEVVKLPASTTVSIGGTFTGTVTDAYGNVLEVAGTTYTAPAEDDYVAQIGEKKYLTIENALTAGATDTSKAITLLADVAIAGNHTIANVIAGEHSISIASGNVTLSGTNTYTGGTEIAAGAILRVGSMANLGASGDVVVMAGGTLNVHTTANTQDHGDAWNRVKGNGTISYTAAGETWHTLPTLETAFATTLTVDNNLSAGIILPEPAANYVIGSVSGSGSFRWDYSTVSSDSRPKTLTILQSKNTTYTGKLAYSADDRLTKFILQGSGDSKTLTLTGTETVAKPMDIEASGALDLTGTWIGEMTVSGTLGGTGTISGPLTLATGATVIVSDANDLLEVSGGVTLPEAGYITVKAETMPEKGESVSVLTGTTTGTCVAVLTDGTNRYYATLSTAGNAIIATRHGDSVTNPTIKVDGETSLLSFLNGGDFDPSQAEHTLTIEFAAENQTFTFDNELPLSFASITVTGEYAGKVTMAEGDVAVETTATTIEVSADFTDANGMHFGATTINADKCLTIDTGIRISSIAGAGQLALAENAEIAFSGATTHTGGTHLPEGSTLTIKHANSLSTAGAITGSGRLVIAGVTPENKTGLNDATWTGVVEFTGALPAGCNFDDYGNEQSMVRFNGASGYTAQTSAGTKMAVDLELVAGGLTINNANSGQLAIVTGALTGAGSLTMSATAGSGAKIAPRLVFAGDTTGFTGNIQVNSSETTRAPAVIFGTASNGNTASPFGLTLGDTNSIANYNPNGKIVVAPGATASVVGTWTAAQGVDVYGTLGGSGKISSALRLNDGTTLVLGESPITVTGAVSVNGRLNVTAGSIATKTIKVLATASRSTIADGATATLNGTPCTLSAQADGLYVVIPGFADYSDVTVQKLLAITGSKIPTTITGHKGTTPLSAADISASLELFENVIATENEGDTVTVRYNFGITSLKINAEGKVETVVSVETTAAPDTSGISQGVTVELYTIGEDDTEIVLVSAVLTSLEKTVTLTTSQTYTEIMDTLFPVSAEGVSASSETLKVYVRAKKASLGEIVASAELDAATGTLISGHGQTLDLYTFVLADAIPADGAVTFNVAGTGAYEGQAYTLTIGEAKYTSELSESGTVTFNLPMAVAAGTEATLAVANATGAIEVLETGTGPVRIQKLLARTPEEDLNPNYDPEDEATTCIFTPPAEGYRDMYRIPAIASDGNGEIVAIYDLRYIEGDLGQTTATNAKTSVDIAESYSTDGGLTWATFTNTVGENSIDSYVKIAIDVPNAYNFATIGGDTTIVTGKNAYSSLNGGNALSLADMDAGDPCIVYDKARDRYLAMVITGGGLVNAGDRDGGQNNGIALYSRLASKDAVWTPLHTKTVTTDREHTISDNLVFEATALPALKEAYLKATGTELPSTKGYFQGPGHGMVTTRDVTDGEGNTIPAGTVVFPMQWFPQTGSSQAGALYSTDGENWKATSLTDYAGAQENCIVELDDGSWLMVAKYNNTGRGYTRTTDFLTWSPVQLKSPARLVQGSIIKIGENSEGKSRYAMITATEGSTGDYTRLNVRIFFATDATDNPENASGIVWDPDTTAVTLFPGDTGGQSYNSICLLEEGIIGVLYEANKHIYFERIDVRNRLN